MKHSNKLLPLAGICYLLVFSNYTWAGRCDTSHNGLIIKQNIIPMVFIAGGSFLYNSSIEQNLQRNLRSGIALNFENHTDNYLPYVPIAGLYLADLAGVQSRNNWFNQSKYLAISNIITAGITHVLKPITKKTRPDGTSLSFPSGHTSFGFTNATVLYKEFEVSNKILAYSGYAFSTTTGIMRLMNNRHWLSDVMVGAGIGILVTNMVYYFEPLKNFNPFKISEAVVFSPVFENGGYGVYFSYCF